MAIVWQTIDNQWNTFPLAPENVLEIRDSAIRVSHESPRMDRLAIVGAGNDLDMAWYLFSPAAPRVVVNGEPERLPFRQLQDRDELMIPSSDGCLHRLYFSTEELPCIEPYPLTHSVKCPRCRDDIAHQTMAVRCPGCRVWHHQSEDTGCWTYSENCGACHEHPTRLDGGFRWSPEELS